MKKLSMSTFAVLCAFFSLPASLQAGPPATIDQLDWMTGNWAGQLGPNQLEENWIANRRRFDRGHGANDWERRDQHVRDDNDRRSRWLADAQYSAVGSGF